MGLGYSSGNSKEFSPHARPSPFVIMRAVKQAKSASVSFGVEPLEERRLMAAAPWNQWTVTLGIDKVYAQYPWLNGSGHGVAVIDKGINYLHPLLGANGTTPSPRIVNVFDYHNNDNDPFPETDAAKDPEGKAGHGTGVAGLFVAPLYVHAGFQQQGMLQGGLLYNLRQSDDPAKQQDSIRLAMEWVVANHAKYHITAVDLTDFIGTSATTPLYDAAAKALWDAGVFVATPVANNFLGDKETGLPARTPIGFPGKSPWIFATGGVNYQGMRPETQRGPDLDLLGPAQNVTTLYYSPANPNNVTAFATGNSWGTPMTVSTAVMIQQIDSTISPAEIMKILQDSGTKIKDPDSVSNPNGDIYYSRLNVLAAIQLAYSRRDDAADEGAGNDSLETATTIGLNGSKEGTVSGQKLLMHDHDYYSFTVSADGKYDVKVTNVAGSYPSGTQLLDADGNVVATIGAGGLTQKALTAGTYFVHLYNQAASLGGTYSISIDGTAPGTPPPPGSLPNDIGANGTFNAMAFDAAGNLDFAWYDKVTGTLKFAKRNANDVWGSITTIDASPMTGQCVSMAIDKNGRPGVAYYDAPNANLKYAHFNGSSWTVEVVDSKNSVGQNPSLKFNSTGAPVIAYHKATGADLRMAVKTSGGWNISAIDATGDVGQFSSLALNTATGRWAVAYTDYTAGGFKYASQNANGTWSKTLVDAPGAGGGYVSLAFDKNKQPGFSYYDAKAADLRLARLVNGKWVKTVVASKNSQGSFSNLYFDPQANFNPAIIYWKRTGDTLTAARNSPFAFSTLATGGGMYAGVAVDKNGNESVAWMDTASGELRIKDL
jgi:hypothetical protein